ncbi:MAG: LCP family protein [Solirubrobacteraceae bacterium]
MHDGLPPRATMRMVLRLLGGCLAILVLSAAAAATSAFEIIGVVADSLVKGYHITSPDLVPAGAGQPQTILILGDDSRKLSKDSFDSSDPPHSDTIMLVRLDPHRGQTSVMSIPRDLEVTYYARGREFVDWKINSAFTEGGPTTSLRVVEHLLHIKVNDIIVLNFQTFADVVDVLGCVYIDVDHWYYIPPGSGTAAINIRPGYKPLCGYEALSYARFRETDSTFARDAREQDFLRQAKQQLGVTSLLTNPGKLQKVLNFIGPEISTNIRGSEAVLRLVEVASSAVSGPVRQVKFPESAPIAGPEGASQTATPQQVQQVVADFLYGTPQAAAPPGIASPSSSPGSSTHHSHRAAPVDDAALGLTATPAYAIQEALAMQVDVKIPVLITKLTSVDGSQPDASDFHPYTVHVPAAAADGGLVYHGYRITWSDGQADGAYYGIEGMDWTDPPLFHDAYDETIHGRNYMFVLDGGGIRDIGWIQGKAVYWVSNTIFNNLTNRQMLALAESAGPVS